MKDIYENIAENADKEIWRQIPGDYYSASIHVTKNGSIGINVGGLVIVAPIEIWHRVMKTYNDNNDTPITIV